MWRPASPAIGAVSIRHMAFIDQVNACRSTHRSTRHRRCVIGPGDVMPQDIEGIGLLVSRSVTKDLQLPERIMENLGIMRLRSVWMTTICPFVTDLDTPPPLLALVVLDQRVASGRGLFRSATAREWGGTDQGLSVLHATWTLVEYTHLSASSTPPLCSTAGPWPMAPEPLGVKTRTGSETPHEVSPLPTGMQRRRPPPPRADKHRPTRACLCASAGWPGVSIENFAFHPERTSPTNNWDPPAVVCRRTQFPINKYVPDHGSRSATDPDTRPTTMLRPTTY